MVRKMNNHKGISNGLNKKDKTIPIGSYPRDECQETKSEDEKMLSASVGKVKNSVKSEIIQEDTKTPDIINPNSEYGKGYYNGFKAKEKEDDNLRKRMYKLGCKDTLAEVEKMIKIERKRLNDCLKEAIKSQKEKEFDSKEWNIEQGEITGFRTAIITFDRIVFNIKEKGK